MDRSVLAFAVFLSSVSSCAQYDGLPEFASTTANTSSEFEIDSLGSTGAAQVDSDESSSFEKGDGGTSDVSAAATSSGPEAEESGDIDPSEQAPEGCFEDDLHDSEFTAKSMGAIDPDHDLSVLASVQSKSSLCDDIDVFHFVVDGRVVRTKLSFDGHGRGRIVLTLRRTQSNESIRREMDLGTGPIEEFLVLPPGEFYASVSLVKHPLDYHDWATFRLQIEHESESDAVSRPGSCEHLSGCVKLMPFPDDVDFSLPVMSGYVGPFSLEKYYLFAPGASEYVDFGFRSDFGTPGFSVGIVEDTDEGNKAFYPVMEVTPEEGVFVKDRLVFDPAASLYGVRVLGGIEGTDFVIHYGKNK